MLIIAQPKSASTSLLETLKKITSTGGDQIFFPDRKRPEEFDFIRHGDVCNLTQSDVNKFTQGGYFYKQHIVPTENNINLLKDKKYVLLLRDPEKTCDSYIRSQGKKNNPVTGVDFFIENRGKIQKEISRFGDWEKYSDLTIRYEDLIKNPTREINKILKLFGFEDVEKIELLKFRYNQKTK